MAIKLTNPDEAALEKLFSKLDDERADFKSAIENYNDGINVLYEALSKNVASYNEAITELRELISEHTDGWREHLTGKSDKWRESAAGERAETFISDWEDHATAAEWVEIDYPDSLEIDLPDYRDGLPESAP